MSALRNVWHRILSRFRRPARPPFITSHTPPASPPVGIDPETGRVVLEDDYDGRPLIVHGIWDGTEWAHTTIASPKDQ